MREEVVAGKQLAPDGVAAFAIEHFAGREVALGGGHHIGVPRAWPRQWVRHARRRWPR
jgi:hypothetical protein